MPVTLNGGFPMPSWFDLYSLDANGAVDEEGLKKAQTLIHELIAAEEKAGIPANRIILGGFSQGGALALYSGLTYPKPIAGILAFSCWIPKHQDFVDGLSEGRKDIPILQCHGDVDPIVRHLENVAKDCMNHYYCLKIGSSPLGSTDIRTSQKNNV